MKLAILIVSRNRPDLVASLVDQLARNVCVEHDVFVVEAGTDPDKVSPHATAHYTDDDFRGKCHAHNVALEHARERARASGVPYDYYWVLMNDLVFDEGSDPAQALIDTLEANPRMAILSPTEIGSDYPGAAPRKGAPAGSWRAVTTCDYLAPMLRAAAVDEVSFLNPAFRYCWGAIHELSYQLYAHDWFIAYADGVRFRHLGGSTYGAAGTNTISRAEYQRRAKRFAWLYFRRVYGADWARDFFAATRGHAIEIDTFAEHERLWADGYSVTERAQLERDQRPPLTPCPAPPAASESARKAPSTQSSAPARPAPHACSADSEPREAQAPLRLHLGSGHERRAGWTNVDVNPDLQPDVVASAHDLHLFPDGSAQVIEACHLFEHFTLDDARQALVEWRRVLAPGGELQLELPNLEASIRLIGTDLDGYDLGLISIFGYPPEIASEGVPQLHKWGWTPTTLRAELEASGFEAVTEVPITQTYRKAAKYDRDMRIVARKPMLAPAATAAPGNGNGTGTATTTPATREALLVPHEAASGDADPTPQSATLNFFAWPTYTDEALARFLEGYGRLLAGRADVCLHLRFDPDVDGPREAALAALERAHARVLGSQTLLEVSLVEGALDEACWNELGTLMDARIRTGSERGARELVRVMPTPIVDEPAALAQLLETLRPRPTAGVLTAEGVQRDPALVSAIEALHPWFYPVELAGHRAVPGVGSVCAPEWLENRARCRRTLLVDEVLARVAFEGRSVLDLACNCAYWSAEYAKAGARSVYGIEGRPEHVAQARLYWRHGGFLPNGSWHFEQGNIADAAAWSAIREHGPFDVTLCAGILYHVPNYAEILRWAAAMTRETLIVDTRVTEAPEAVMREPGDLRFNAINETLDKVVPNRERLLSVLRELGLAVEVLPVGFGTQLGVSDGDDYAGGARLTVIARKVPAPLPAGAVNGRAALQGHPSATGRV